MNAELQKQIEETKAALAELEQVFELMRAADRRAVARWREAHPNSERVLPDRADLVEFLINELEKEKS
jgi:hypothetical protein